MRIAAGSAAAVAALVATWWWAADPAVRQEGATGAHQASVAGPDAARVAVAATRAGVAAPSATITTADAFLVRGLGDRIEQLFLEAGTADSVAALRAKLQALVAKHFTPSEAVRAAQLVDRYVDYRVALAELKPPSDPTDPRAVRRAIDARQKVRAQYFTGEERDALFGAEEALDRFTVQRLEIARNDALTPAQKQQAIRAAEADLGDAERAARAESVVHEAVAAQTAALDAANATEAQRYAERQALYGDGAAQRLAALDREERDWRTRLDQYAAARTAAKDDTQLAALRQQLFTREEQLRLDGALALRALAPAK